MSSQDISHQLDLFQISPATQDYLKNHQESFGTAMSDALGEFYTHISRYQNLVSLFQGASGMEHAKQKQIVHWQNMLQQPLDDKYVDRVRRIGQTHYRLGLEPHIYIGGYSFLATGVLRKIYQVFHAKKRGLFRRKKSSEAEFLRVAESFLKIAMLDMANSITLYLDEEKAERDRMLEDILRSVDQTSHNVDTIAAAAEEMTRNMEVITSQVCNVSNDTNTSSNKAQEAEKTVHELEASSKEINKVMSLIRDIADQTHMLSLNATIEASRSGEAGKGFAVVASEVKNLANQTHEAISGIAKNVDLMMNRIEMTVSSIRDITQNISKASNSAEEMQSNITEQIQAINDVNQSINSVSQSAREVTERVRRMRGQAGEQAQAA
ncbi:MAG: globin-coupled sensor protein [Rhodospirillales bacterium]|nr:globin-coupled sensor protein [Rhodospirillales bacterium]